MNRDTPGAQNLSILIVEDEVFIAHSLKKFLDDTGASHVVTASTLCEAKGCLETADYDATILDVRLPDGEAYDLAAELVEQDVPVVIHSGHATSQCNGRLSRVVFCSKPATPEEILRAIGEARARVS